MVLAPKADAAQATTEAVLRRLLHHRPSTFPGPSPVRRETEQVEATTSLCPRLRRRRTRRRRCETHEPRLVRVKAQAVLAESLRQYILHSAGVLLRFKHQHEVVSISRQVSSTVQSRFHLVRKPLIQNLVQVNVRKYRRNHATLRHSGFRTVDTSFLHHTRLQPFADEAQEHAILHPLLKYLSQPSQVDRPEEIFDVRLQHPAAPKIHPLLPYGLQCLVRRAPWSKAVRAIQKVLLVHGIQHHGDRALKHLVFESRDPDGSRLFTVALRDVHTPHRRRAIVVTR